MGERIEPELQALVGGTLRPTAALLVRAGLVIDDDRAIRHPIDAIPSPDDAVPTEHEAEALLHEVRAGLPMLVLVEATKRREASLKTFALMSGTDKPFGQPCRSEYRLDLREGRLRAIALSPEVVLHRLVQREAVGHLRRRQRRNLKDVLEAVEKRALLVVVDRFIRHRQDVVGVECGQRSVGFARGLLETLELLCDLEARAEPRRLSAEGLGDEAARGGWQLG